MTLIRRSVQAPVGDNPPTAFLYYGQNVLETLRDLPDRSVQMVCTSPPYWGLRDYGTEGVVWGGDPKCQHQFAMHEATHTRKNPGGAGINRDRGFDDLRGQQQGFCRCGAWKGSLGLEPTPELFVEHLVEIFRDVHRVLRDDGTIWLNLGDSYVGGGGFTPGSPSNQTSKTGKYNAAMHRGIRPQGSLKPKDLVGIPWMVAFALRADGWFLRSDIIWSKANCMPESVRDRPTNAHEYVFLLSKSSRYYYDAEAIKVQATTLENRSGQGKFDGTDTKARDLTKADPQPLRNRRTVWDISTRPFRGAHFAVWPPDLVELMVKAGSSEKGNCPCCGAPWVRTVDREHLGATKGSRPDPGMACPTGKAIGSNTRGMPHVPVATVGWEPSCQCTPVQTPERAVVLDPFSGSATTGAVAFQWGRNYIGIDLNADYIELAESRLLGKEPRDGEKDEEMPLLDLLS